MLRTWICAIAMAFPSVGVSQLMMLVASRVWGHMAMSKKKSDRNLIVGLDIGTSKVVALVGEIKSDNSIEIIGFGSHPSRGLKKGVVVNIESTVASIQRAVEE